MARLPVIAIDGTAASGKGTIARALAAQLGFDHLDTGALYRAVAALTLDAGGDPNNPQDAIAAARRFRPGAVAEARLRTDKIGEAASIVSAIPEVRAAIKAFQMDFAQNPPGGRGAVIDGRDIGTIICPDAPVKIFVTADLVVRAGRRHAELDRLGIAKTFDTVLEEIRARDDRDMNRAIAPLKPAPDSVLIDTTAMTPQEAIAAAAVAVKRL